MAKALMEKALAENGVDFANMLTIDTAGLDAYPGDPASEGAIEAMRELGVDLKEHRAKRLDYELVMECDLIVTMGEGHKKRILSLWPEAEEKVVTLAELAGQEAEDVKDPFGRDLEVYRQCRDELEARIKEALSKGRFNGYLNTG